VSACSSACALLQPAPAKHWAADSHPAPSRTADCSVCSVCSVRPPMLLLNTLPSAVCLLQTRRRRQTKALRTRAHHAHRGAMRAPKVEANHWGGLAETWRLSVSLVVLFFCQVIGVFSSCLSSSSSRLEFAVCSFPPGPREHFRAHSISS